MRNLVKLALCASLPWVIGGGTVLSAQSTGEEGATALLSFEQGQALVDFALQQGRGPGRKPDCSHLVHKIYNRTGLHYAYAESRDLYQGVHAFEQVSRPQPGDLIVWRGHVGIVVSPEDRTFFSSVRSGIVTEPWTTDSWKMRGRPRFFRYRIGPATDQALLAALTTSQMERDDSPVAAQAPGRAYPLSGKTTRKPPADGALSPLPAQSHSAPTEPDSPSLTAVIHQRAKPTKKDVAIALRQSGDARAEKLIAGQLFDLSHPISIIERMEVRKVKISKEQGLVILKLNEILTLADGKVASGKTVQRQLILSRRNDAWVISDPQERLYLPQEQALGVFKRQAEFFLQRKPSSSATRSVVKALDVLYDQETASTQRAAMK